MVLVGIIPFFTFALGTWQVKRLKWKVALIDDLEEKLEVAQVQLELYNTLLPRQHEPEVTDRFKALSYRLYNITEVSQASG